ncbi:MAG TPA: CCA tRNA nucleotidyltransferase [Bacillales bacterium]|nr:CCA tRNA nucleotidyltransferase [Bacillales bacterium]
MQSKSFNQAAELITILKEHGYAAYIVGGAVRDHLLGKEVDDIDIATSAQPEEVRGIFPKTIPVGVEHGTIVVRFHHHSYEVTTFRSESDYEDHRRPSSVTFVSSLTEDLKRRDFTINALAMSETGEISDPFSGSEDLKAGLIRSVGHAEERFAEDPLRMMRAARFASQLCFEVEEKTRFALRTMASDLQHISVERISVEFEKLLLGSCFRKALALLIDSGLFAYLPGMSEKENGLRELAETELSALSSLYEKWTYLLIVLQIHESSVWLKKWKLSNDKIKKITQIRRTLDALSKEGWKAFDVYKAGLEIALSAERVRSLMNKQPAELVKVDRLYRQLPVKNRKELAFVGNDLLDWFQQPPGPWLSKWIEAAEEAIVEGLVPNEKEAVRRWLLKQTF